MTQHQNLTYIVVMLDCPESTMRGPESSDAICDHGCGIRDQLTVVRIRS